MLLRLLAGTALREPWHYGMLHKVQMNLHTEQLWSLTLGCFCFFGKELVRTYYHVSENDIVTEYISVKT